VKESSRRRREGSWERSQHGQTARGRDESRATNLGGETGSVPESTLPTPRHPVLGSEVVEIEVVYGAE
jgi:hypothetical protein